MTRKLLFLFFIVSIFGIQAQTSGSLNVTFLGQVSYPGNQLSNLWGYVAPDGTEYAVVGTENGVSIVSLANPANPVEVQFLPGIQTIWREVKVYGDYAYIGNEGGDGLRIVDLSGLPGSAPYKDTIIHGNETIHTVSETDGYLYLNGTNVGNGGFQVLDLHNDPWRPEYIGEYTTRYVHDCYVRGNTMYAGQINDGLLAIIDVTNKNAPVDVNTHSYINSFTHNAWLNDASTACFTTDEKNAAYVYAWDITDPMNIQELDKIRSSLSAGASIPHNIHVINDYGVTSYYRDGVVIFDVAHPNNMIEVGYYDTSPMSGGGFNGAWGVFNYFPSGNIIVSDMEEGLFVLRPNYIRGCYLEGLITDANTSAPISGATIALASLASDNSLTNGNYATGTATAGSYQVTYSKPGYISQTITVNLSNGVTTTQNIQLVPAGVVSASVNVVESWYPYNPVSAATVFMTDNNGLDYNYSTAANGTVAGSIVAGNYDLVVGKWGYITQKINVSAITGLNDTIYLDQGYYDDAYFDFGWTESGTAPRGNWERGEPAGTSLQNGSASNPDDDAANDIGVNAFVTGNGGGNVGDDDVDNGYTELTSPEFDLTAYNNPVITYSWWFFNADLANQGAINDHFILSLTDGTQTVQVKDYSGVHNSWNYDSIVVSNFITPSATMKMILKVEDATPGHITEGAFDYFFVKGAPNQNSVDITDFEQNVSFAVYPNPFTHSLTLSLGSADFDKAELSVYDIQGKQLKSIPVFEGQRSYSVDLPQGIYTGYLKLDNKVVKAIKLIRE